MKKFLILTLLPLSLLASTVKEQVMEASVLVQAEHFAGTGFVIQRTNGAYYVWTAAHVVKDMLPEQLQVRKQIKNDDGFVEETRAWAVESITVSDDEYDLALLKLTPHSVTSNTLATARFSTSPYRVGQKVFAVGNPYLCGLTVTSGTVSQKGVAIPKEKTKDQTDCPIFPGNSGGPICNLDGGVIGVVVSRRAETFGYFVPVRVIRQFAKENGIEWAVE